MSPQEESLTPDEGTAALKLARRSLEHYVRTGRMFQVEQPFSGGLALPCGAFVTLNTRTGQLRGCIGHMVSDIPLGELIIELGRKTGTEDPRFPTVTEQELSELTYEISVLSPMKPTPLDDVAPGVHGLYIRKGTQSGVLLPQVAVEWGWNREEFLQHTCQKAGLPDDAWQEPDTEILTFTAQVFSET